MLTADQEFTLIISGIGLLFALGCATLGLIWRAGYMWSRANEQITRTATDVTNLDRKLDEHLDWHMDR